MRLAENAGEARGCASAAADLVLLDIWMPDTDGITLLKEWAASGQLTMPVVMMSGHGTIETAVEATRIGAFDFLEKPMALQRLLATVKRALRSPEAAAAPRSRSRRSAAPRRSPRRRSASRSSRRRPRRCCCAASAACGRSFLRACSPPPAPPFLAGAELLAEPPLELLAKATGRHPVLLRPDAPRADEQRSLEFLLMRAEKHKVRVVSFSPLDVRSLVAKSTTSTPSSGARLSELDTAPAGAARVRRGHPDLASLMLAQMVEARACPPRRSAIAALNALRHHAWPGNLAELEGVVKDLALTALEEGDPARGRRARAAPRAEPGALPEVLLDRPYREAREAFERVYFEHSTRARQHVAVAERSGLERTHLYRKLKALGLPVGRREE